MIGERTSVNGSKIAARFLPNPASEVVSLQYEAIADGDLQIEIMDARGNVQTLHHKVVKGFNEHVLQIQHLASGIYFVALKQGDSVEVLRLAKLGH